MAVQKQILPTAVLSPRLPPVSRLAVGSLTVGPLQANLPPERAGEVLAYAFDAGINLIDTAQYYQNYAHIRAGLERCRCPEQVVLASKTYAYEAAGATAAVEEARTALNRDVIDIFLLHEQESIHTLRGHREALDTLFRLREKGVIRAVGISTHHVAAIEGAVQLAASGEIPPLDVVHPLLNRAGIGIADGTPAQMEAALAKIHAMGCGVYGMKALAGGHLYRTAGDAIRWVLAHPFVDAVAVGMQHEEEVDANIAIVSGTADGDTAMHLPDHARRLHIEEYCEGCGNCVARCPNHALYLTDGETPEMMENPYDFSAAFAAENGIAPGDPSHVGKRAAVHPENCVLCGYCTAVCPMFALKVY